MKPAASTSPVSEGAPVADGHRGGGPKPPTVVVTRAVDQAAELADRLTALGLEVLVLPAIRIDESSDGGAGLRSAIGRLHEFGWLVVTSPNGARRVLDALGPDPAGAISRAGVRIAVVGPGSARVLATAGVDVDLVATTHTAEGLLADFPDAERSIGVLLASADMARDVLSRGLSAKGWDVTVVEAYRTVPVRPTTEQAAALVRTDVITFASGSAVRALVGSVGPERIPPVVVTIGPIASAAARDAGLDIAAEADPHTIDGLVAAVLAVTS